MVAGVIVTWKSVALRFANEFRLIEPPEEVGVLVLDEVLFELLLELFVLELFVVVMLGCSCTVMLVGGLTPSVRFLSRLVCITATSTTTSGLGLSRSLTILSPSAAGSREPRSTR